MLGPNKLTNDFFNHLLLGSSRSGRGLYGFHLSKDPELPNLILPCFFLSFLKIQIIILYLLIHTCLYIHIFLTVSNIWSPSCIHYCMQSAPIGQPHLSDLNVYIVDSKACRKRMISEHLCVEKYHGVFPSKSISSMSKENKIKDETSMFLEIWVLQKMSN